MRTFPHFSVSDQEKRLIFRGDTEKNNSSFKLEKLDNSTKEKADTIDLRDQQDTKKKATTELGRADMTLREAGRSLKSGTRTQINLGLPQRKIGIRERARLNASLQLKQYPGGGPGFPDYIMESNDARSQKPLRGHETSRGKADEPKSAGSDRLRFPRAKSNRNTFNAQRNKELANTKKGNEGREFRGIQAVTDNAIIEAKNKFRPNTNFDNVRVTEGAISAIQVELSELAKKGDGGYDGSDSKSNRYRYLEEQLSYFTNARNDRQNKQKEETRNKEILNALRQKTDEAIGRASVSIAAGGVTEKKNALTNALKAITAELEGYSGQGIQSTERSHIPRVEEMKAKYNEFERLLRSFDDKKPEKKTESKSQLNQSEGKKEVGYQQPAIESIGKNIWQLRVPPGSNIDFKFDTYVNWQTFEADHTGRGDLATNQFAIRRDEKDKQRVVITTPLKFTYRVRPPGVKN